MSHETLPPLDRATPAMAAAAIEMALPPNDQLFDDGLCLFWPEQPDPDLVWKAEAYDRNTLTIVQHESVMTDAAEVLLTLLRQCGTSIYSVDYLMAMRAHFDLVYPRAVFNNETDAILREFEAKRAAAVIVP